MYRKFFTVLFLISSLNIAQSVKVIKTEKLITGDEERLYFPRFGPGGNYIALTKSNHKGLWLYNLSGKVLTKINDYYGSGFEPVFTNDNKIHFNINEYKNKRGVTRQRVYNIKTNIETEDTLKSTIDIKVRSVGPSIEIINKGKIKSLSPLGRGFYLWVELSPEKDKILFTFTGKGTYVCDLEGRITTELGYANAGRWSPDGNWIVYMNDKDDGHKFISSDIYIISVNGETKINITQDNSEIVMYPDWSPEGDKIVYHSLAGQVFITELRIFRK